MDNATVRKIIDLMISPSLKNAAAQEDGVKACKEHDVAGTVVTRRMTRESSRRL
jgi:hypothetical protein